MRHEDELTTEELQEILNEEHQENQRNVSPSEQEEEERGPMPTSASKDLFKNWDGVRAMVLEWHPNQADVSREDFGKRNMPGKHARRHFSQLSEFERGLIIGLKTAGWSTRHVAGQVDRSECAVRNCWDQWTREGTHARKTGSGVTRKTTRVEDRAASTCGSPQ
ncbi:uncharacterized protein TNCV_3717791 [Trichonephila clavipes]|nr:uncharacterized protein TNCV_3717791 [Trichonephila clavipes]